jgi:magnesium chelatase subunit D
MSAAALLQAWNDATLSAALFAVDPLGAGINLRARAGSVRDAWMKYFRALLPEDMPFVRMPCGIGDERLLGGLDLTATLRSGRPVAETGLLAQANGGVLIAAMAERLEPSVAARIGAALDHGEMALERDGLRGVLRTSFGMIALDEGADEDERPPAALLDRLAFHVDLSQLNHRIVEETEWTMEDVRAAKLRLASIDVPHAVAETLTVLALQLGITSLRAPLLALRVARAACALRCAGAVAEEDIATAMRLVLVQRATQWPSSNEEEQEREAEPQPPEEDNSSAESEDAQKPPLDPDTLRDIVLEAVAASLPPNLLEKLQSGSKLRKTQAGKAGAPASSKRRGRPYGSRQGDIRRGRLALVDTLRAAAPWQALRRRASSNTMLPRIIVQPDDFRVTRFRSRTEGVAIFLVDASGSAAMQRLAEAKGAIELLLADCYVRRESVALIAFRGTRSEIILPPTRSLARARRVLSGLPGGGGTPLASALDEGLLLAESLQRRGQTPLLVLLTDGRANVARDGSGGRTQAHADALQSARRVRAAGIAALAIDTAAAVHVLGEAPTRQIGEAMAANYIKLPRADASQISAAVRLATAG